MALRNVKAFLNVHELNSDAYRKTSNQSSIEAKTICTDKVYTFRETVDLFVWKKYYVTDRICQSSDKHMVNGFSCGGVFTESRLQIDFSCGGVQYSSTNCLYI